MRTETRQPEARQTVRTDRGVTPDPVRAERPDGRRRMWSIAAVCAVATAAVVSVGAIVVSDDGSPSRPGAVDVVDGLPATYEDLVLAANWASWLESVRPDLFPPEGHRSTSRDLLRAAMHARETARADVSNTSDDASRGGG